MTKKTPPKRQTIADKKAAIAKKPVKPEVEKNPLIPEKYQAYVYIGIIILSILAFYGGAIFGGGFNVSDNISSMSFNNYLKEAARQGHFPLWVPYIFSGMPSFSALLTTGDRLWDFIPEIVFGVTKFVGTLFSSDVARMSCFYIIYALGIYLLMRSKNHERFVSFFTSLAAVFSTCILVWIMIGHNTKPVVFAMFPFVLLFVEKLRVKFSLLYSVLLVVALHLMMEAGHIQMIFYSACALGLYLVFELISRIIKKEEPIKVLRAAGLLIVAGGVAFLMSSDRYLSTLEYTPYSTRGSAPIEKMNDTTKASEGGNDYEYATNWSFSPEEMFSFFVPNYFGFGKLDYSIERGGESQTFKIPTYWGQKPFDDAAPYMGIGVLGLALLGLILYRKDVFVQFLFVLSLFSLYLSFGNNSPTTDDLVIPFIIIIVTLGVMYFKQKVSFKVFLPVSIILLIAIFWDFVVNNILWEPLFVPILNSLKIKPVPISTLYDFFFYYIPSFDKFRAPSMSLVLLQFTVPVLAGFGLTGIFNWRKNLSVSNRKLLYGGMIASAAFLVFGFLFSLMFKTSYIEAVSGSQNATFQNVAKQVGDLPDFVWAEMISDWYITGIIAVIFAGLIYLFVIRKINSTVFYIALPLILIFDLWRVGYRPMEVSDVSVEKAAFQRTDVIDFLKQDASIYRIADFSSHSNAPAYFLLENVNGYHSAKLRVYQDLMDVANQAQAKGSTSVIYNPFLWALMNVKYLIAEGQIAEGLEPVFQSQQSKQYVFRNPNFLPRAFFVDSIGIAPRKEILYKLRDGAFHPRQIAYLEKKPRQTIEPTLESANAKVIEHRNEYIKISAEATGNNLLFISEIYYPPCWRAYIDGKETTIYKANFAFRAVVVPPGKHTVEMKFYSKKFEQGKNYSLFTNIFMLLALAAGIVLEIKKSKV